MKKFTLLALAFCLACLLIACGGGDETGTDKATDASSAQTSESATTETSSESTTIPDESTTIPDESAAESTKAPEESETDDPALSLDHYIAVTGFSSQKDYEELLKSLARAHYTFTLYTDEACETEYVPDDKPCQLYVKYTPVSYQITYMVNDAAATLEGNPSSYTIENVVNFATGATPAEGYSFAGWFYDADCTEPATGLAAGSYGDVTVYAKFTANTYNIQYVVVGGTNAESNPASYVYGSELTFDAAVADDMHVFVGWYADEACTKSLTGIGKTDAGDKTVYAKFKAYNKVTYVIPNGVNAEANPAKYLPGGDPIDLVDAVADFCHKFDGWYADAEYQVPCNSIELDTTGDLTFYAKFTYIPTEDAYFDFTPVTAAELTALGVTGYENVDADEVIGYAVSNKGLQLPKYVAFPATHEGLPVIGTICKVIKTDFTISASGAATQKVINADGIFGVETRNDAKESMNVVYFPSSFLYIGTGSFLNNGLLKEIVFAPDSKLQVICDAAFLSEAGTSKDPNHEKNGSFRKANLAVESITIPASVRKIGDYAFSSAASLKAVYFEEGSKLESIGTYAFGANVNTAFVLRASYDDFTLVIPASVKSIGAYAFGNLGLHGLVFAGTPESIGDYAFAVNVETKFVNAANALKSVKIPGCPTMGGYIFSGNCALENVTFADDFALATLPNGIFENAAIRTIALPECVKALEAECFAGCRNFEGFDDYMQFDSLGSGCFSGCTGLENTEIYLNFPTLPGKLFAGSNVTKITIGKDVKEIAQNFHMSSPALTELVFEDGGTEQLIIGSQAFKGTSIKALVFPDRGVEIGSSAFYQVSALESIDFGEGVVVIGSAAFAADSGTNSTAKDPEAFLVTDLMIPANVTSIGANAFHGQHNIKNLTIAAKTIGDGAFAMTQLSTLTLEEGVETIGKYAFYASNKLGEVSGEYAKGLGQNIASVNIPSTVTMINQYAFQGCPKLATLTFTMGGTAPLEIAAGAFDALSANLGGFTPKIKTVTFPARLTSFTNEAFYRITTITAYNMENPVPDGLETPKYTSFEGCLYTADMTTFVGMPGGYTYNTKNYPTTSFAFMLSDGKTKLQGFRLPESVKFIGEYTEKKNAAGVITRTYVSKYVFASAKIQVVDLNEATFPGSRSIGMFSMPALQRLYMKTFTFTDSNGNTATAVIDATLFGATSVLNASTYVAPNFCIYASDVAAAEGDPTCYSTAYGKLKNSMNYIDDRYKLCRIVAWDEKF